MRLRDYRLYTDWYSGNKYQFSLSFESPFNYDIKLLTRIYLKYHSINFASLIVDYNFDIFLTFLEHTTPPFEQTLHSVLLQKPIHTADMRISIIPELVKILDNYNVLHANLILPEIKLLQKTL